MANSYFQFKQFTVQQDQCAMKVTTDSCLFGAWTVNEIESKKLKVENVLDIGTGTGLLSLMLAQKFPSAHIDAIEIDEKAATQAGENVKASPWKDNIQVIKGDAVEMTGLTVDYNVIICNPPFYENELRSPVPEKEMAHHDSGLRLEDVLITIRNLLAPAGRFYLLLPYKRMVEAALLIQSYHFVITRTTLVKQSTQHDHFRLMVCGEFGGSNDYTGDEIAIWDEKKEYTPEFIDLLKDYYLYL